MSRCYVNVLLCLLCVGCSSKKEIDSAKLQSAEEMYTSGCSLLKKSSFEDAAEIFKKIESLHPYSSKACDGQLLAAYSYFMSSNYSDAMRELDIFLRYHSSHALVPYAVYLRAMCLYVQTSTPERDQQVSQDARQAFAEIINRYPNTPYAEDSMKRIVILDDTIASHEMEVGKFYQRKKNMLAAVGRYNFIVDYLRCSPRIVEANYRIIECYQYDGLKDEAVPVYEAMKKNFPNNPWTIKAKTLMSKEQKQNK